MRRNVAVTDGKVPKRSHREVLNAPEEQVVDCHPAFTDCTALRLAALGTTYSLHCLYKSRRFLLASQQEGHWRDCPKTLQSIITDWNIAGLQHALVHRAVSLRCATELGNGCPGPIFLPRWTACATHHVSHRVSPKQRWRQ